MQVRSGRSPTYSQSSPVTYRQNGDGERLLNQNQHDLANFGVLAVAGLAWAYAISSGGLPEFSGDPMALAVLAVASALALDNMYGHVSLDGLFGQ